MPKNNGEYAIFEPVGNTPMRDSYSGINEIEEFSGLSDAELRFAWFYGSPDSEYQSERLSMVNKTKAIIDRVWKLNFNLVDKKKREAIISGNFNQVPGLKEAIDRFKSINSEARNKAYTSIKKIFDNLNRLLEYNESDFIEYGKDGEEMGVSYSKKSQFAAMQIKIADSFPDLIKRIEEGFGVNISTRNAKEIPGFLGNLADTVMAEKRSN